MRAPSASSTSALPATSGNPALSIA